MCRSQHPLWHARAKADGTFRLCDRKAAGSTSDPALNGGGGVVVDVVVVVGVVVVVVVVEENAAGCSGMQQGAAG